MPVPRASRGLALSLTTIAALCLVLATFGVLALPAQAAPAATLHGTLTALPFTVVDPVYVTHAGDGSGRLFVVQRSGQIRIFRNNQLSDAPFLSITARVGSASGEQGLLSVAFPSGFAGSQRFYVYYTDLAGTITISRFNVSANPDRADPSSETKIITIPHPTYSNHNGGQLQFGPDGFLYAGTGDGGSGGDPFNNALSTTVLLGKLLRIDPESAYPGVPTYTVPASNPFAQTAGYRHEIWALGLRNPWRFSFDRLTGDLYIGDVGQGAWEEVDVQPAGSAGGQNYDWSCFEGFVPYAPNAARCAGAITHTAPVTAYPHGAECSVTGGYVYRGAQYAQLAGRYIFGDFCSGRIWALSRAGNTWTTQDVGDATFQISSFGEDESGALYIAAYSEGRIYRLGNLEPAAYLPLISR
ncbi:MAG: PQQ-dependent sugar dehydrogenase [Chloroflexi bacterium]|nr:PQQ-dependent sugar dehydrogenase [Chloroflexota bacterium]